MSEWTTTLKISFAIALLAGLILFGIGFVITGEYAQKKVTNEISESTNTLEEFFEFNEQWIDKETALLFTYSCIGKHVELKINSKEKGIIKVDLSLLNIRKELEKILDRDRFYIKISQDDKVIIFLDEGV